VSLIPKTRGGALPRFAAGAVIVIAFTATTTAVAGLLQFKQAATYLSAQPPVKTNQITVPDPGNPQTLLLIGSDHRAGEPFTASNTDTMLLVRLDPNSTTINMLSLPRDLRVEIPGFGTAKLNAAYSLGGPDLLLRTIKENVFPDLHVNHIIDINFGGFAKLVNAIGCVYTDVDHRYYNNTALTDYSSIDLQPGYQKLCGSDALSFVRFRHTDTDIVRNARQQDFLRWAKDQYSTDQIISNRDALLKIFGQNTQTDRDLHTVDGLINLFNLVAFSAGHTIKQIPFPAILLPCAPVAPGAASALQQTPCYVTADPLQELVAYDELMNPTTNPPPQPPPASGGPHPGAHPATVTNLTADPADGKEQAAALHNAGMPVYYPRVIASGSSYCSSLIGNCYVEIPSPGSYPRAYVLHDREGSPHPAYRMTLVVNPLLGEYYGVQGTTWLNPPLLGTPTEKKNAGGKQLLVYANGGRVSLVAWRTPQGVYWISNTLTDSLSNQQMVSIAASLTRAG
jgi:LCP family protein required for cell wall assembly